MRSADGGPELAAFQLVHLKSTILSDADLVFLAEGMPLDAEDAKSLRYALGGVASIVVESNYIDKDYRNVYSGFYSKKFARLQSRAVRWHLFDVRVPYEVLFESHSATALADWLGDNLPVEGRGHAEGSTPGYLGYIVLRPTEYSRIGRCLLDPRRSRWRHLRGAEGLLAPFRASLMGQRLRVMSFPTQSQDAEVHLCAETAIWSLFRYLSQRYPWYSERYPLDVSKLNQDLERGRPTPGKGLTMSQMTAMIGQLGIGVEPYDLEAMQGLLDEQTSETDGWASLRPPRVKARQRELVHLIATSIESGIPAIVGVPGHALVAVGTRYRREVPTVVRPGGMRRSTDYLDGVVVNDDNFPPFQLSLWKGAQSGYDRTCATFDCLVMPLPDKVLLRPESVELITTGLLNSFDAPRGSEKFVRRLYCTSSKNYKEDRRRFSDLFTDQLLKLPLPHFVWITEVSAEVDWVSGGRVLVEVALDATAGPWDVDSFLWVRYPRTLLINASRIFDVGPGRRQTKIKSRQDLHVEPFRGNLTGL